MKHIEVTAEMIFKEKDNINNRSSWIRSCTTFMITLIYAQCPFIIEIHCKDKYSYRFGCTMGSIARAYVNISNI